MSELHLSLPDALEPRTTDLLHEYENRVKAIGGVYSRHPQALSECLQHARLILENFLAELRGKAFSLDDEEASFSTRIGSYRAKQGASKLDCLRATELLFEMIATAAAQACNGSRISTDELINALLVAHRVVWTRANAASIIYDSILLKRVHELDMSERRRLAREIHDRIGNSLSLAQRNLELHEFYVNDGSELAGKAIGQVQSALLETAATVRHLISDLRLPRHGAALESSLKAFAAASESNTKLDLTVSGMEAWAPPEYLEEIFLVLREALRNVFTHAKATRVTVRVDIEPDDIHAVVRDNGVGIAPERLAELTRSQRQGITGMIERTQLLQGDLRMTSQLGRWTMMELWVPVPDWSADDE